MNSWGCGVKGSDFEPHSRLCHWSTVLSASGDGLRVTFPGALRRTENKFIHSVFVCDPVTQPLCSSKRTCGRFVYSVHRRGGRLPGHHIHLLFLQDLSVCLEAPNTWLVGIGCLSWALPQLCVYACGPRHTPGDSRGCLVPSTLWAVTLLKEYFFKVQSCCWYKYKVNTCHILCDS